MPGQLGHVPDRVNGGTAGQGGLGGIGLRNEDRADASPPGGQCHGKDARRGAQFPGQGQLPHKGAVRVPHLQLPAGGQDAYQDGQVVQRA